MHNTEHVATTDRPAPVGTALRLVAAIAVLVSGLVHLQLWFDGYRDFPDANLGRSFLANAIASVVIAAVLVWRRELVVRLAAIGLLVATLIAFVISRSDSGIFGFSEQGLNPSPQAALALAAEIIGLVVLVATLVPAIGGGDDLPVPAAAGAAAAVVVIAVIGGALWARSDDAPAVATGTSVPAPASTVAPSTTVPPTTQAAGPTTTASGGAPAAATTTAPPTTIAPATTAAAAGPVVVSIADFTFREQELQIPVGTTVEWVNEDSFAHTVVSDDGSFVSETMAAGDRFSFTFETAGEFAYACGIHPSMLGTIIVTG